MCAKGEAQLTYSEMWYNKKSVPTWLSTLCQETQAIEKIIAGLNSLMPGLVY